MKKLSEIYKELGIDFTFPIKISDANNNETYFENRRGYWRKHERDAEGNWTYSSSHQNRDGYKRGTPRSAKTWEGKVIEVDGFKYKLTAL